MKAKALLLLLVAISLALPASAAQPLSSYKLELVARPPFTFLSRFGETKVDVYGGGVRAHNVLFNAYSKNGDAHVTVMSPQSRLYAEHPLNQIGDDLRKLRTDGEKLPAAGVYPLDQSRLKQTIAGMPATRFRILLGPDSWMDVWSTDAVVPNPQYRKLLEELVTSMGNDFTASLAKISGTPIKVVIETRRFHNTVILEPVALTKTAPDEKEALSVGSFYARAPFTRVFSETNKKK